MVEQKEPDNIFLVDKISNTPIPLLRTSFEVDISLGFADIALHQVYENNNEHQLETLFLMPYSDLFVLNKIAVNFTLQDGTIK